MKDFYSFDEYSIPISVKALFWGLYMVVFVYAVWKTQILGTRYKLDVKTSKLLVAFFAAYAVFYCVNPDYFSYRDWLHIPDLIDWHKEQVYAFIIMFCRSLPFEYPFEVFRLIVWGGGVLLFFKTARLYRDLLTPGLAVMLLFVFFSSTFCYARASLAIAVFFTGVGLYLCKDNSLVKMSGIGLAICSYFFHHELIIGVLTLPCLWMVPFERKQSIYLSSILLAIIIVVFTYINSNIGLMESVFGSEELAMKMEAYFDQEQGAFRLSTFVKYTNIFYPFLLITAIFYRYNDLPKPVIGIFRVTSALIMATVTFMVVSGLRSTYTYRVMYINMIPLSILIAYCYGQGLLKKYQFAIMLILALLSNSVRLINAN